MAIEKTEAEAALDLLEDGTVLEPEAWTADDWSQKTVGMVDFNDASGDAATRFQVQVYRTPSRAEGEPEFTMKIVSWDAATFKIELEEA